MFFPYEIGIDSQNRAKNDDSLVKFTLEEIPSFMELYVENKVINTLTNPLIIDFTDLNDIEFPFVPAIPKALEEYDFFN